jgi:hypothetical protein
MNFERSHSAVFGGVLAWLAVGCVDVTCAERGTCPPTGSSSEEATETSEGRSGSSSPQTGTETTVESVGSSSVELDADVVSVVSSAMSTASSSMWGSDAAPSSACSDASCLDAGEPCDGPQRAECELAGEVCWVNSGEATCVECVRDSDCPESTPTCVAQQCVVCDLTDSRGCPEQNPYCVSTTPLGAADGGAHGGATSSSLTPGMLDGSVVLADSSVDAALPSDAGFGLGRECVACRNADDCGSGAPFCVDGACVQCEADTDCTSPTASRCDAATKSCVPCSAVGECAHLSGTSACDIGSGTCVECTAAESTACEDTACVTVPGATRFTCSSQERGDAASCEPCVSDAACATGRSCVLETFDDEPTEWVCLPKQGSGPGETAACSNTRLTTSTIEAVSADAVSGMFCKPRRTTCAGVLTYGTGGATPPGGTPPDFCQNDDDCGLPGVADGVCVPFDGNEDTKLCTYPCQVGLDCVTGISCDIESRICGLE